MNFSTVAKAVFISMGFTGWPIIGRYSGATGGWVGIIVLGATVITVGIFSAKEMASIPAPGLKAITLLVVAGIVNGIAFYLYSMTTTDSSVPTGVFVVTVSLLMVTVAPVLDYIFNEGTFSRNQVAGLGFAFIAILMLSRG